VPYSSYHAIYRYGLFIISPAVEVFEGYIGITLSIHPSVCSNVLLVQLLLNKSTSADETLHSYSLQLEGR